MTTIPWSRDGAARRPAEPVLTMAQLTPYRVYQRSTKTGGAAGKGEGTIAVPVTLTADARLVECRLRDAMAEGNPVLTGWTAAPVQVASSGAFVSCQGVPADQKQYLVDLRCNRDDKHVQLGRSPVMMGRLVVHWGQSQA
ncbi:MAG: hypothetical protein EON88_34465, partial [Brevundimonas sp.]